MKMNCGPSHAERFILKQDWHRKFLFWPQRMTMTNECLWLETVERKGDFYAGGYSSGWRYAYRAIK